MISTSGSSSPGWSACCFRGTLLSTKGHKAWFRAFGPGPNFFAGAAMDLPESCAPILKGQDSGRSRCEVQRPAFACWSHSYALTISAWLFHQPGASLTFAPVTDTCGGTHTKTLSRTIPSWASTCRRRPVTDTTLGQWITGAGSCVASGPVHL